jgi:YkoY family integral membrane protein
MWTNAHHSRRHGKQSSVHVEPHDLITILLLVLLEGILSADNALVLAVLVLPLPPREQRKALQYGIIGAFVLRTLACIFAAALIQIHWMKLVGGLYLLHLAYKHFFTRPDEEHTGPARVGTILGLSAFWSTVARVEMTDLVFAIDSILMAVGMSQKLWVIITGGILGIIAIRLLTGQLLTIIKRYPALIDGAYIIISWIGIKLTVEYLHGIHVLPFEIPKAVSLTVVVLLFGASYFYARARPNSDPEITEAAEDAEELLK